MTTLEERRQWMRAGCPVDEHDLSARNCRSFRLHTWPTGRSGKIVAKCLDCGELGAAEVDVKCHYEASASIKVQPVNLAEVVPLLGAWIDGHSGNVRGTAARVLGFYGSVAFKGSGDGMPTEWARLWKWVAGSMSLEHREVIAELARGGKLGDIVGKGLRFTLSQMLGDPEARDRELADGIQIIP